MVSSIIFQKSCVLHHFHRYSLMSNSRIHWYLQEGEAFFFTIGILHFKAYFFRIMWFEVASTPNFIFSHIQWHLLAILAKSLIRGSRWLNRKARAQTSCSSPGLSSLFRSVASRACQKFQTQKKTHARRTWFHPPQPPQCVSLYMCGMLVNDSERYHNQVGNIKFAFPMGSLAAPLA